MKRLIVTAVLGFTLAACGAERSGTIENEDGSTTDYSVDASGSRSTTTVTTDEGTTTIETGGMANAQFPKGYSAYPGAKILTETKSNGPGGMATLIMFESTDEAGKITEFYKQQAIRAGVKIELEMNSAQGQIIGGQTADGGSFSLTTGQSDDKTVATLTVGDIGG